MSPLGVLAALAVAACATPAALGAPWFFLIYLVPIGIVVWVLRTRTMVDSGTVTTRSLLTRRRVRWDDIASLHLRPNGKVAAVLTDGTELALHAVRVRDLPVLAAASGGRLPDPEAGAATPQPANPQPGTLQRANPQRATPQGDTPQPANPQGDTAQGDTPQRATPE
jgi:hypothetical protein